MIGILLSAIGVFAGASEPSAQSTTIRVEGNVLHLRAPAFHFIRGLSLSRLKDGRAVRFDFGVTLYARPGAATIAQAKRSCTVSYDLWEERFAATADTSPARSISHLSAVDSEVWCLDHVTLPLTPSLSARDSDAFYLRLEYEAVDADPLDRHDDTGFSIRGLVDRLSRPRTARNERDAIDAGPFRLSK